MKKAATSGGILARARDLVPGRPPLEAARTAWLVRAKLTAMALMLGHRRSLRHHLRDRHPTGTAFVFEARFLFVTRDERVAVHALFAGGRMRVGGGVIERPDVVVRFRDARALRAFFEPGADSLEMLLANDIVFEGNLAYLFKFGQMSAAITLGGARQVPPPERAWRRGPERWQDLPAPPAGEPCRDVPPGEVRHLAADPYLANVTLDDLPAVKRLLWAHRTVQPEICTERARLLTEHALGPGGLLAGSEQPPVLRQAEAVRHILLHKRAIVRDDDLLAGTTTSRRVGVVIYPECGGAGIWPELLTMEARELNPYRISDEDVAILDRQVFPFWMEDNVRDFTKRRDGNPRSLQLDDRFVLYFQWKTQAVSHTIADVPQVLRRGLADIRAEASRREAEAAADPERAAFYRALGVAIEGLVDYAGRLAEEAEVRAGERRAAGDMAGAERFGAIAATCRKVPAQPAETLREAIQAVWLLFLAQHQESVNAGLSVGRLDTWLDPYFQRDMAGVTDPVERRRRVSEALELVCGLMLKLTDHLPMVPNLGNRLFGGSSSDQVITLGGVTPDGASAVCDLTWVFLKATEMLRLRDPNMNARYAPGVNSEAYLRRLCEVNLLTRATPSLHSDDAVIPALLEQGFALPDARDWGATGCVEPTSCGRHYGHTGCIMFNLVAPLEMALNDGIHPILGEQVGPRTGDPRAFQSYEAFFQAYAAQLRWLIGMAVDANNRLGRAHQQLKPTPLLSALFTGPMDKGRDLSAGGAVYNSTGMAMVGLTDVIDSLAVIETLVFAERVVDLGTLLEALAADFEGHEVLRARILGRVPRFGQDHELPRRLADEVMAVVYDTLQAAEHYRGGRYVPGYWSMSNHVAFGTLSGALPSGRRRGKAFTPGLTPSHLTTAALTDQLVTVASLDAKRMPNNIAFNVKVVPGPDDSHQAVLDRMQAYVASYFDLGGMQMQFNVVDTGTLRDAMANPEGYRDLLVRISGYNAYFVELNRDIQQELVERYEHSLGLGPG